MKIPLCINYGVFTMNIKKLLLINALIFSAGGLIHLLTILLSRNFVVAGFDFPKWASVIAVIFAAFMAYQNYTNSKK